MLLSAVRVFWTLRYMCALFGSLKVLLLFTTSCTLQPAAPEKDIYILYSGQHLFGSFRPGSQGSRFTGQLMIDLDQQENKVLRDQAGNFDIQ